ncbi:MAG: hypothetical protein OXI95_09260 [bacterium]|nr:hypothetical protein [bacterium]
MTPENPEQSRRTADELRRRERQARQPEPALDPATLAALLAKHEAAVEQIVARAETALMERIDSLAGAQGAVAESVRRGIERGLERGGEAEGIAALVRRFGDEQRAEAKDLSAGVREGLSALTQSLDHREGTIFDRIDRVAERVTPGAEALGELRQAVAGAIAVARDVAAIKDEVVRSGRALDEVAAVRETVADNTRAMKDMSAMRPVLGAVANSYGTWSRIARRWLWLASILLVVFGLACGTAGVALQRETAIWLPLPEVENRERDAFWERHGEQVMHCYKVARAHDRGVWCPIIDLDP